MRIFLLFLFFLATPALAETQVRADLDGDGALERYELTHDYKNTVTLRIWEKDKLVAEAPDLVWKGGLAGQDPELALASNGSVQVISQNEGCCRNRWRHVLTLAYRQGAIRVAGVTYTWRDTLDLEAFGTCDVNLLTGKGFARRGNGPEKWFRVEGGAPQVTEWAIDTPLPKGCEVQ
ncbi:hypothetical protein [Cognatishimia maritima]|uniref:Uncharacterized protein n=1 Tax=Cognatishimia maritima TaxID=870908 RepID=A0A1M5T9L9_9RHOB|nr:hypothetical protein [Cognatishimia maritima]SHH47412.1 hypothetical protein SAMN04488044_2621 [Cognatishimia maritima]